MTPFLSLWVVVKNLNDFRDTVETRYGSAPVTEVMWRYWGLFFWWRELKAIAFLSRITSNPKHKQDGYHWERFRRIANEELRKVAEFFKTCPPSWGSLRDDQAIFILTAILTILKAIFLIASFFLRIACSCRIQTGLSVHIYRWNI